MPIPDHIDPGNSGGSVQIPELPKTVLKPVEYPCSGCDEAFKSVDRLRKHRINAHPIERPYLYLNNQPQQLSTYIVTSQLQPSDIHFEHAQQIYVDGVQADNEEVAAAQICERQNGCLKIRLVQQTYTVYYDLQLKLISDDIAGQVEAAFLDTYTATSDLDEFLRKFVEETRTLGNSAQAYVAGLDRYIVAIMAKERITGCQIAYEDFPDKLGESRDRLQSIRRPFSEAVCSLISLILADFRSAQSEGDIPFIAATKSAMMTGVFVDSGGEASNPRAFPVDHITEKVVKFSTSGAQYRLKQHEILEDLVASTRLGDTDRMKLQLLLMAFYSETGDAAKVEYHYRRVQHIIPIGNYARKIYEGSKQ